MAGEQQSQHKEYGACHQPHMQAGNRQQMRETGIAHGVQRPLWQAGTVSGQQRRCHGPGLARQGRTNPSGDRAAQPVDADPESGGCAFGQAGDISHCVTDAAYPLEIGMALKVETAGRRWPGRRAQHGAQPHKIAMADIGHIAAHHRPHPARRMFIRQPADAGVFQRQPDIAGPLFDADQLSLDAHRADLPFQKECTGGLAAILRRRETQREGAQQQGQQPPVQRPV